MALIKKTIKFFKARPIVLVFLLTLLSHGLNLFGYPAIEGDEGVYVGQAWWLVNFDKITPYAYWYDHFPLGWLQIGLWQKLTGGPFSFGMAVFSGRVFVTLLAGLTNVFLFLIVKKVAKNTKMAFLASLFFAFSPLAILYHRRVLLDNIAVFWLILAVYRLISAEGRLWRFFQAGLFWGLAFLSKESMVFFLPAFLIGSLILAKKENRAFSCLIFCLTFFALASLFPLLALLKGEFFPAGWFGGQSQTSFLETLFFQMGRGEGLAFWQAGSDFRTNLEAWLSQDYLLLIIGVWCLIVNLIFGSPSIRLFALMGLSYMLFLIRGGLVLNFYFIPLIPFLAGNIGLYLHLVVSKIRWRGVLEKGFIFLFAFLLFTSLKDHQELFFLDATRNQREMVNYIKRELEPDSVIVTDFTPWVDLRLARTEADLEFRNTEWFYKAELDPEIRYGKLRDNYYWIDYIVLTDEVVGQLNTGEYPFLEKALENSSLVLDFSPTVPGPVRNLDILESYDASWVSLYKVDKENYLSAFGSLMTSL